MTNSRVLGPLQNPVAKGRGIEKAIFLPNLFLSSVVLYKLGHFNCLSRVSLIDKSGNKLLNPIHIIRRSEDIDAQYLENINAFPGNGKIGVGGKTP